MRKLEKTSGQDKIIKKIFFMNNFKLLWHRKFPTNFPVKTIWSLIRPQLRLNEITILGK